MSKHTNGFIESMSTPWFGVTTGLLGIIIGYSLAAFVPSVGSQAVIPTQAKPSVADVPAPAPAGEVRPVNAKTDWIKGNPKATFSFIEWSDAECPFCARHHPTPKAVLEKYGDEVNWVYRHFPLSFHQNAQKSAEAQECAGFLAGNDAFWKFTDILFEKGAVIASLPAYAAEINLDAADFKDCLDSGKFAAAVKEDMADGSKAGVTGTPGNVVINNKTGKFKLVSGAQPASAFEAAIESLR